jgi:hypothetical protein
MKNFNQYSKTYAIGFFMLVFLYAISRLENLSARKDVIYFKEINAHGGGSDGDLIGYSLITVACLFCICFTLIMGHKRED